MREGHEVYPTLEYAGKVVELLKKSGLLVAERTPDRTSPGLKEQIRRFTDYIGPNERPSLRLSKEAFTTCGIWQHNNASADCQLFLAEIPLGLHKFNMLTSHHLQELEGLFSDIVYDSSSNFTDYFEAALRVCPDVLLHHSDEYLAALVNTLSQRGKKYIFVVCGYGQSRTVPYHLYYNPRVFQDGSIDIVTRYNRPFGTLIRSDTPQVMVDKLAIIDQILNSPVLQPDICSRELIAAKIGSSGDQAEELCSLYSTLIQKKFNQVKVQQQARACSDLQNRVKQAVRDNPKVFKQLQ